MAAFGAFSTLDALQTLSTSIPDWNQKLEELNSQIALRQIELARIGTENERPSTQSLKNKGSTESLRPQDGEEEAIDVDIPTSFDTPPKSSTNGPTSNPSAAAASPADLTTAPLFNQRLSHIEMSRKPSVKKPIQSRLGLRKRKTESMASAESQAPKYRTRSMIIVYYDSAVQTAFEDLVKFVSASRNSMRKGKMNAKMEAMRRAAEQEVEDELEEECLIPNTRPSHTAQKTGTQAVNGASGTLFPTVQIGDSDSQELDMSQMKFTSTRNMGPPRDYGMGGRMGAGMMRNARSAAGSFEVNDIFDELDKGLEWSQGQCERAAHQFLRDGDCSDEIEGIKKRLLVVKAKAEQEVEKLKKEEALNPPAPRRDAGKSREMRPPQMRKAINKKPEAVVERKVEPVHLEVDRMEVDDDEGYEDVELPPIMTYRRTRDMGCS